MKFVKKKKNSIFNKEENTSSKLQLWKLKCVRYFIIRKNEEIRAKVFIWN